MKEQDKVLKKGVTEDLKLTLIDENSNKDNNQTVSVWIDEIKFLIRVRRESELLLQVPQESQTFSSGKKKLFQFSSRRVRTGLRLQTQRTMP